MTASNSVDFQGEPIGRENLLETVAGVKHEGVYLLGIFAIDNGDGSFEIKYFFGPEKNSSTVKALSILASIDFPSISGIMPAAKIYEREIMDMFGLFPLNHPDLKPLMLFPENWDGTVHPLKKDWDKTIPEFKKYGEYPYKKAHGNGVFEIPVGPVHAGIIEPGHFRFSMRGEPVLQLEIRHFWKHRGIEKLCEGKTVSEALKIVSRISGDNSAGISLAYLEASEKILGIEIPIRAKFIRVILAEIERLWNHVRDIGYIFMDMGYTPKAQAMFVLEEDILRLNKFVASHRYMFDALQLGGVASASDIDINKTGAIRGVLKSAGEKLKKAEWYILNSPSVTDRIELAGKINKKTAEELSLCGICARASGLRRDSRIEMPYLLYGETVQVSQKTFEEGDILARTRIRIMEAFESINIIQNLLAWLPESGEDLIPKDCAEGVPVSSGWAIGNTETPRGNAFFYIKTGEDGNIERLKYIDPSFRNWPSIQYGILGGIIADFPLVNKSMNLSYAGNDL